jgi:exodeoxyribonuclease VII large subunit
MIQTPVVLSVSQLNTYIKSLFDGDENLSHVFISGEISNFTNHYKSGHFYLSLKDEKSVIRAVMFAREARRVRFLPQDGMKVIVRGRVGVYEVTGQYQLYIDDMQPDGLGALNLAFEQLKAKLQAEGLFDAQRKKPLPPFPERIGVITSPTGAAVHDITTVLARRYPLAQVILAPVLVQGAGAAPQIVAALRTFNRLLCADVIILGRGGGSLEDLWPFNEESVARAVADSRIPVISAVGHETDFTICDFAADLRAPTPSAAAELAAPDSGELLAAVIFSEEQMTRSMLAGLESRKKQLDRLAASPSLKRPQELIELQRMRADHLASRLSAQMSKALSAAQARLSAAGGRLHALSPLATLSRGYSIAYDRKHRPVSKISQAQIGDFITIRLQDGSLGCTVGSREENNE